MKNTLCFMFMSFALLVVVLLPSQAHAGSKGEFYDKCWVDMNDKIPRDRLEKACSCTQKKGEKYLTNGVEDKDLERVMLDCFSFSLRAFAQGTFYKSCMSNLKYGAYPRYQQYCKCSAATYSRELLRYGPNAFLDGQRKDELQERAVEIANRTCLPANMQKKKTKNKIKTRKRVR